jgi:hypothetical protein
VSEDIVIPPKHYNSLIGAGGKLIHAIMEECGGVTIKFPPTESNSDKVTIRGPKDDVEKAKQQLLELSTERQLSGFTAEVRAKPQHHKFLIGRNGVNIKKVSMIKYTDIPDSALLISYDDFLSFFKLLIIIEDNPWQAELIFIQLEIHKIHLSKLLSNCL